MTTIRDLMTPDPQTIAPDRPIVEAARLMRDHDIGALVVATGDGRVQGIVTDRDLAVRVVADGMDPSTTPVGDAFSASVETVTLDSTVDAVIETMRRHALRRVPVVEDGMAVGIISLGDLAMERDPDSALGEISAAPPND